MNGHKSDLRKYIDGNYTKTDNVELYEHLKQHGQDSFKVQILEQINMTGADKKDIRQFETMLDKKEREWIWRLETMTPKGLNMTDGYYSHTKKARKQRVR